MRDYFRETSDVGTEPLTQGEREFLLDNTDLTEADLTREGRAAAQEALARSRAQSEDHFTETALTTAEVAELLGRDPAGIRRSKVSGDLYAPVGHKGTTLLFPAWQFAGRHVVPGLRQIIPAFPRFFHPLSIEHFMTAPNEELNDLSPVQWLVQGGAVRDVVVLVDALGYV